MRVWGKKKRIENRKKSKIKKQKVGPKHSIEERQNETEIVRKESECRFYFGESRAFNQGMENRKANLTTAVNRGRFTSHQMTGCKTNITDAETVQENFQAATPLRARKPWTKGRFQLSQLDIRNKLVPRHG